MLLSNHYGPDPRVAAEIDTLRAAGYSMRLICWDRDFDRPIREEHEHLSIRRVRIRSTHRRGLSQGIFLARYWLAAIRRAWDESIDLVHAHDFDTWPAAGPLASMFRVPLVLDVHDSFSDMMAGYLPAAACRAIVHAENRFLRRADAVVTVGGRLGDALRQRGAQRVTILPNAKRPREYRVDAAERRAWRARLGIRPDQWCLGFISHLGHERPVPAMIEAVASDPRVVWVVGGAGYFEKTVADAARRLSNVRFLGHVPPADVPQLTAKFDAVFCGYDPDNPNARYSAPNKLFDALAAGRPLLSGDYGEVGEIIARHRCGATVHRFVPAELRAALDRLADPDFRKEAGDRAAALGRGEYDWDRVRLRLPALYASLGITGESDRRGMDALGVDGIDSGGAARYRRRMMLAGSLVGA